MHAHVHVHLHLQGHVQMQAQPTSSPHNALARSHMRGMTTPLSLTKLRTHLRLGSHRDKVPGAQTRLKCQACEHTRPARRQHARGGAIIHTYINRERERERDGDLQSGSTLEGERWRAIGHILEHCHTSLASRSESHQFFFDCNSAETKRRAHTGGGGGGGGGGGRIPTHAAENRQVMPPGHGKVPKP